MQPSAQSNINDLVGEYYLQGVMETASGLRLKADSSFDFFYSYGATDRSGKGRWQLRNNRIILNSGPRPNNGFALTESKKIPGDSLIIKIADNNSMILRYVQCLIQSGNQIHTAQTDANGFVRVPLMKLDSLRLLFTLCPDRPSFFNSLDKNHNYFEFCFEKWICEVFFNKL